MNPLPLENGALFISASFLERLETCPRSAQYYKLDNRISIGNASGLNFGKILHSALELYNIRQGEGDSQDVIDQKVLSLLEKEFSTHPPEDSDHRNLNWAVEIYQNYVKQFEFDQYQLLKYEEPILCPDCQGQEEKQGVCLSCNHTGKRSVMAEVPFAVKLFDYSPSNDDSRALFAAQTGLFSIPIYYHGYIDLPVKLQDQIFVLDYKTTSVLGASFWDDKKMSAQQKGYCWAMQESTGMDVAGYVVRAIRTSKIPDSTRNGTPNKRTGEVASISKWWSKSFPEEKFYLGTNELQEWKENAIALVEEFLWHYSRGYFPKKTQWCSGRFGRCQYFEVCSVFPPEDRPLILNSGLFKSKDQKL